MSYMNHEYHTLSFFQRGKRRKGILLSLKEPKTPKEIATLCKISISNVSNALSELMKKGFVECINPNDHTFKYFQLTSKGKKALTLLDSKEK